MTAIFAADRADREAGVSAAIDWSAVTPRDEARRARVRVLLGAGALASGDDFIMPPSSSSMEPSRATICWRTASR